MSAQRKEPRIVLDTAQGGYACSWCSLDLLPNEPQVIIGGQGKKLLVICEDCIQEETQLFSC